jgi:hypothetical protein
VRRAAGRTSSGCRRGARVWEEEGLEPVARARRSLDTLPPGSRSPSRRSGRRSSRAGSPRRRTS